MTETSHMTAQEMEVRVVELEGQVLALRGALESAPDEFDVDVREELHMWRNNEMRRALTDTAQAGREAEARIQRKAEIDFVDYCIEKEGMSKAAMENAFAHNYRDRLRNGGSTNGE